jgi:catechol 2,3-dioxygenase-like lactoylglutathione lyase family enzyme
MSAPTPELRLTSTVLGSSEPRRLAGFYQRLLGWRIGSDEPEWVTLRPPGGGTWLSFQYEPQFRPPVWPSRPDEQQMTAHLDIAVTDLAAASRHAEGCGAKLADFQPQEDVRVYLDPDGHPFCLYVEE